MAIQGTDIKINFSLKQDDGSALDLSGYPGITVHIYDKAMRNPLLKFSRVSATGYIVLSIVNAAAGTLEIILPKAQTATFPEGEIMAEVRLKKADGTYSAITDVELFTMEKSITPQETIPV